MRHYRTQKIEIKKLDEIICNCCGKKISVINEVPQEDIVEVEKHWGYLSKKDGQKDAFVKAGGERGAQIAKKLQQGLPAIALSAHPALVTAFMNDVDPDLIYAQQVIGYGRPGDLLIGVSTSGNAKNVAAAVIAARAAGVATLGLSGRDGGELARLCDECLVMPEHETYRIQEYHIAVYHLLCAAVESELFEH